ncbi:D-alanine transaminase/branched-chain amino acid aminotransferase [Pedobacter westerhofensis]|uniref:branched-chain-amino-acid transaminase n=1 Tax=Pedobacter westerhofensis TaxID=425512 RepID=A0A521FGH5_9SPHI|nr:aminotransferase class IV [Pedobacter westerhofensis]SMO95282.1 D-alanine transaminase/branched-chain amino acid aminotransferase [Pedobacter westerhofensis]
MAPKYVYINDTFVAADQASLLITDLAIQRGYGIFDFFKTIGGKPIFLQDHIERFYNSARKMHMEIPYTHEELKAILAQLMEKNDLPDSGIRLTLCGGYSPDGFTMPAKQNLIITQLPFKMDLSLNTKGIKIVTRNYQRQLSGMKTIDYSMAIWLQPFIKENNADDVLYHDNGQVKEVPRANFFMVSQANEIITAKTNILPGVIRKNLLALKNHDFNIIERDFSLEELYHANEAFITSTTKHIMPVVQIDGKAVGDGKAGKISAALLDLLVQKVREHQA